MTPDLSRIIQSVLIEIISEKIVERLTATKRKALVLLDMSDYGIGDAVQQLNKLHSDSWSLDVAATREVLGAIPSTFPGRALAIPQADWTLVDAASPMTVISSLLSKNEMLIVPNMSLSLAAKVANGISDDAAARFMVSALESGKPIVAAKDGCCPACRAQDGRPFAANDAYRAMMISHLEKLDAFGVRLCRAAKLSGAVEASLPKLLAGSVQPKGIQKVSLISPQAPAIIKADSKRVFGWRDAKMVHGAIVNIAEGVVVTPLALEELKARDIRVVRH